MSLSGDSVVSEERRVTDSEDEQENEEEDDFEATVMTAKPPEGGGGLSAVAAADILDYLDQLVDAGKISGERAGRLKRKYNALIEGIEISRAAENSLLHKCHELQKQMSSGQLTLEKGDGFPETDSSETSKLRQNLLQQNNHLLQCEQRTAKLDREIEQLEEERRQLQREYDHLPKKEEIEEKHQALVQEVQLLQDEIDQRVNLVKSLKDEIHKTNGIIDNVRKGTDELHEMEATVQDELASLTLAPLNLPREMDKIKKSIADNEKHISDHGQILEELEDNIARLTAQANELKEEVVSERTRAADERRKAEKNQLTLESVTKSIAIAKEQEAALLEEGANTELQFKHRTNEFKMIYESLSGRNREKDKDIKSLKRAEIQLRSSQSSLEQQQRLLEPLEVKLEEMKAMANAKEMALKELTKEVETLRKSLAQMQGTEEFGEQSLEYLLEKEKELRSQAKENQNTVAMLSKEALAMMKQRDNRAKDFYKAIRHKQQVEDDLRKGNNKIEDQQKRLRNVELNLGDFAQAYELVKTERNVVYSQIQSYQQLSAEMREKLKVLQNEMEILHNAVDGKTKVLARSQLAMASKTQDRDTQQLELTKLRIQQDDTRNELDRQYEILCKLTHQINSTEQTLNRLCQYYEQMVQSRNDTGLQLIERNEEVCVFHEKINVQSSITQQGIIKLTEKEEEIQYLNMEIARLQREIKICQKTVPEKEDIERELLVHQNMLIATKEMLKELEDKLADARDPSRIRLLPGKDPSCSELRQKVETLQVQLTDREQQLLEKELLLEQITRVLNRTQKKAEGRKETTLQVGSKVNSYQSKLRDMTRKMMAHISELSVQRSLALHLHQVLTEKEAQLEQTYSKLEAGEPPDDEVTTEILKKFQRHAVKLMPHEEETYPQDGRELPNGVYTTAEPRPNAYIPDSDTDLPLPKPYGSHAPFKPTKPGANIRHIRKSQLPPVNI